MYSKVSFDIHCQAISYLVYLIHVLNKHIVKLRFRIKAGIPFIRERDVNVKRERETWT